MRSRLYDGEIETLDDAIYAAGKILELYTTTPSGGDCDPFECFAQEALQALAAFGITEPGHINTALLQAGFEGGYNILQQELASEHFDRAQRNIEMYIDDAKKNLKKDPRSKGNTSPGDHENFSYQEHLTESVEEGTKLSAHFDRAKTLESKIAIREINLGGSFLEAISQTTTEKQRKEYTQKAFENLESAQKRICALISPSYPLYAPGTL